MRVRFWREGEASELTLGAILPNKFPRQNQERNQAQVKAKFLANNPSSNEHQSFCMAPFLENRNGQAINQNNPAATTLKRRLQCKRSSTQSSSKISSLDIFCLFSSFSSTIEHSFTERGRKGAVLHSELANNYTRPMGLRNRSELQNRTAKRPWQSRMPFTPGNVTNLSDCLLVEEIRNLIEKGAILESF